MWAPRSCDQRCSAQGGLWNVILPSQFGRSGVNPLPWERAAAAKILVAITFHFDAARLGFLAEVLRSLSEYPVASMDVALVTNTFAQEHLALLRRLCAETLQGKSGTVRSYGDLRHPYDLTWCHKSI